jgi:hypothetical protein
MKLIYSARDSMDAEFVKGILDEQGIEAVIQGAALSNVLGTMATNLDATPEIWVRDEDEQRGLAAVADFKSGSPPAASTSGVWKCPQCGEQIEGQFTECWNCGESKPAVDA